MKMSPRSNPDRSFSKSPDPSFEILIFLDPGNSRPFRFSPLNSLDFAGNLPCPPCTLLRFFLLRFLFFLSRVVVTRILYSFPLLDWREGGLLSVSCSLYPFDSVDDSLFRSSTIRQAFPPISGRLHMRLGAPLESVAFLPPWAAFLYLCAPVLLTLTMYPLTLFHFSSLCFFRALIPLSA